MQTSVSFINDDSDWLDRHFRDGWKYVAMVSAGSGAGAGHTDQYGYSHRVITTVILEMSDNEYKKKGYPERFNEI